MEADTLETAIAGELEAHRIVGCAIAARVRGRDFGMAWGTADAAGTRQVDAETVFHLFSGTKLYTAAAIMMLVERGAIDLDADVRTYLPELALRHPVTVRQLASHSSGLRESFRAFMAIHLAGDPAPSTAVALSRYRTDGGRAPGRVAYRNVNYAILGEVVSRVSGTPFEEMVRAELLEPLGVDAAFEYTESMRERAAEGTIGRYNPLLLLLRIVFRDIADRMVRGRTDRLVSLSDFCLDTAAIGGLLGRARDFLPLALELLDPTDGILSAASKRTMLTAQARGRAGVVSAEGVGIGWKLGRSGSERWWNHEGGGPGFTSETRIYPDSDTAVVILLNATQTRRRSVLAHSICERLRLSSSQPTA